MIATRTLARLASLATTLGVVGAAHAAFTFGTLTGAGNASTFASSVRGSIDTFNDLTINTDLGVSSLSRSTVGAQSIGYTVSTASDLFTVQASGVGGSSLTVAGDTDTLTFSRFSTPVTSFGIHFFLTDLSPSAVGGGLMSVTATDIYGANQTYTFTQSSFSNSTQQYLPLMLTLSSTAPLQSVLLAPPSVGSNPNVFATVDDLVLAPVPEAGTWMMLLGGGALLLPTIARRRRG